MYQNKFPIVLFFFLLTVRCHQVPNQNDISDEDIFDNVLSIKLKHMDGLNKILKETDLTYLVYYYKRTSRNSIQGARMLYNIAHRLDFLAQIIMIDCEDIEPSDTPQCVKDPNAEDGFPRIEVYEPPTFKYNPYTKQMSNHTRKIYSNREVGENLLYNFVTQNIPSRAIKLTRENFDAFAKNMDMNKVILFTDKPKTPLLYRGISNFYYDQILFGEVSKDEHALIQKFKVTSFPTLLVYQTHEEEIPLSEPYVEKFGGKIIAQNIAQFLQPYVLKQKHYLKTNLTDNVNELKYKVIFKKLKTANVISYLTKFKNNHFVIYFDNKIDNDNVDLTALADDVKRFNKETYGFFMFIHLDCTDNEEECAKNFDVREYPSMLLVKKSEQTLTERIRKALPLPFDYSEIYKEITREFLGQFKETNGQVFSSTLRESTLDNKIPFIYFYNSEEIPLGLHLISTDSKFSGKIELILYENPRPEVLREMQITKLPQLNIMLLDPNEMKK